MIELSNNFVTYTFEKYMPMTLHIMGTLSNDVRHWHQGTDLWPDLELMQIYDAYAGLSNIYKKHRHNALYVMLVTYNQL